METFVPVAALLRHKSWGRKKCSPFCSLLLFICCKLEVAVYLFLSSSLCLFFSCSILKKIIIINLARLMNIQRIDKPVTIGFILAWNDSLGYSKTPISASVVCNEITQRVVVYLEKGPTEDRNIDTNKTLDSWTDLYYTMLWKNPIPANMQNKHIHIFFGLWVLLWHFI